MDGTRTDRKRVKNETGSGSPSVGAVTRRSGVGDFSGEAEESDGFGSSPERGPLGGEKGFSSMASVDDMVDATRRDGRRLNLSQTCSASIFMPGPGSDMPTPLHVECSNCAYGSGDNLPPVIHLRFVLSLSRSQAGWQFSPWTTFTPFGIDTRVIAAHSVEMAVVALCTEAAEDTSHVISNRRTAPAAPPPISRGCRVVVLCIKYKVHTRDVIAFVT